MKSLPVIAGCALLLFSAGCVPMQESSQCTITLRVPQVHAKAQLSVTDPEIQSAVQKINAALVLKGFSCTFANLKNPVQTGCIANYQADTIISRLFLKGDTIQIIFSDFIADLNQRPASEASKPCHGVFAELRKWYGDKWVKMKQ